MSIQIDYIFQWSQITLQGLAWRTFHPIMVEIEDDRILGGAEIQVVLMGVGVRLRLNYAETEITCQIDELQKKNEAADE